MCGVCDEWNGSKYGCAANLRKTVVLKLGISIIAFTSKYSIVFPPSHIIPVTVDMRIQLRLE